MKYVPLIASLLLATSVAAPAAAAPESKAEAPATFTINTPIAQLMADEGAKAVVEAQIPGIDQHPAYDQFKGMSLVTIKPFSDGMITDAMLAAIAAGLAKLG